MRSITATMWVTLDGVVQGLARADEDTRGGFTHGGWGPRYDDEVLGREMAKAMAKPGDMLLGRRTWQDFITVWGRATDGNPFTARMNATTKYVVSTTLENADAWQNSILLRGDAIDTVAELKAQSDRDLGIIGVAKPTVFAAAGSKQAILKQLRDITLAGDDEPVPVAQRPWYREALAEPDPRRALYLYARNATAIHRRSADVHEVLRAAAASDKDLHELWRASEDERRGGATIVIDALLQKSRLKAGLDRAAAIDIVWVLTASDIFWRLVHTRRWSDAQFQSWLGDTLCAQLLPPAEPHPRS